MLEVLEQFRVIVRSIRRHYQEVERQAGLSGAHVWALAQVAEHPASQVGQIARALAIHQSTASNLLRRLESLGLVARQRRGADRRHVYLEATAKGRRVLERAPRPLIGVLQHALSDLPAEELDELHARLAGVLARMKTDDAAARRSLLSDPDL